MSFLPEPVRNIVEVIDVIFFTIIITLTISSIIFNAITVFTFYKGPIICNMIPFMSKKEIRNSFDGKLGYKMALLVKNIVKLNAFVFIIFIVFNVVVEEIWR